MSFVGTYQDTMNKLGGFLSCTFEQKIVLGVQNVFKIWSAYQTFVIFTVLVISNIYIFFDTKKNNPELWGNVQCNRNVQISLVYIHGMEV